jgi:hypothetical protein
LEAESESVRRQSIALLRRITGLSQESLPYKPDAANAERAEQAWRWRQWLAANGISAELSFPRQAAGGWADAPPLTGRTLVCRQGLVQELDEDGNEVFRVAANRPWACDVTPEEHRLIGDHVGRSVIEYDEQGKEVWAVRDLPGGPMSVRRLENGNTLVALSDANLVAEYDPQGNIAWSVKVAGRPCDARRLPDGRTLVAAHRANRIVEFDANRQGPWRFKPKVNHMEVHPGELVHIEYDLVNLDGIDANQGFLEPLELGGGATITFEVSCGAVGRTGATACSSSARVASRKSALPATRAAPPPPPTPPPPSTPWPRAWPRTWLHNYSWTRRMPP